LSALYGDTQRKKGYGIALNKERNLFALMDESPKLNSLGVASLARLAKNASQCQQLPGRTEARQNGCANPKYPVASYGTTLSTRPDQVLEGGAVEDVEAR